jgi:hypothetical protein
MITARFAVIFLAALLALLSRCSYVQEEKRLTATYRAFYSTTTALLHCMPGSD